MAQGEKGKRVRTRKSETEEDDAGRTTEQSQQVSKEATMKEARNTHMNKGTPGTASMRWCFRDDVKEMGYEKQGERALKATPTIQRTMNDCLHMVCNCQRPHV